MCAWNVVIPNADLRANEAGSRVSEATERNGIRGDRKGREVLFSKLDEFVVVDAACAHKYHAIGGIVGFDVVGKVVALNG